MPTWRGTGERVVRPGVLAQPHQPVRRRRQPPRRVVQRLLERDSLSAEPLEMLDALVAVDPQLLLVHMRTECRVEIGVHVIGAVLEPACLLYSGTATQVYLAAGLGGRSTRARETFDHEHVGTGGGRLQCVG